MDDHNEIDLENRRWKHRRQMAYISLIVMVILALGAAFWDRSVVEPAFYAFASIVGAYMGFSTWAGRK